MRSTSAFEWSSQDQAAALDEGWYLTTACTPGNDVPLVGRVGLPETIRARSGQPAPAIPSVEAAWLTLMHGTGQIHARARSVLEKYNPVEFGRLQEFASRHSLVEQRVVLTKVAP